VIEGIGASYDVCLLPYRLDRGGPEEIDDGGYASLDRECGDILGGIDAIHCASRLILEVREERTIVTTDIDDERIR
jgi:hypothetical protein